MKFYRATPLNTIPAGHNAVGGAGPAAGGLVVAVRLADLAAPARQPRRPAGRRWWWPAPRRSAPASSWYS